MSVYVADVEVFEQDWVVVFKDIETKEYEIFINQPYGLTAFLNTLPQTGWFNGKHYDQFIIKAIANGANHVEIKELNDFIIEEGRQGWEHHLIRGNYTPLTIFDLKDDLPLSLSLKAIEGNLGLPIKESSVSFDYKGKLNKKQMEEVVEYCKYDVDATEKLLEMRANYIQSKIAVGELAQINQEKSMYMTNAKLVANLLAGHGAKPQTWDDDTFYEFPENLIVENQEVLDFFKVIDPTYKSSKNVMIAGVKHTLAYGGLHGARDNFVNDPNKVTINVDVRSYYPSLMIEYDYFSRAIVNKQLFIDIYNKRVELKAQGKKKEQEPLKLVLNTTYGTMKNQYNALYDPRMANAVCISGQLFLIDLIEKLTVDGDITLVQSNTDGIMIEVAPDRLEWVRTIVKEWETRTRFVMEEEMIEKVVQKDVNNYLTYDSKSGKTKVKGGWLATHNGRSLINGDMVVVSKAIVEFLTKGIPVEDTINQCNEVLDFQMIAKTGRTYDKTVHSVNGEDIEVQRVNRVYASKDKSMGTVYKIKSDGRRDKVANLPMNAIIDNNNEITIDKIDKEWYIILASKRIRDFVGKEGGEKFNMENVIKVATKKTYLYRELDNGKVETLSLLKGEVYPQEWVGETVITKREFDAFNKANANQETSVKKEESKQEVTEMTTNIAIDNDSVVETLNITNEGYEIDPQEVALNKKIFGLMEYLSTCDWTPDGINDRQEYEYISAKKYKRNLLQGCIKNGLLLKVDIYNHEFVQNITSKMHLTTLSGAVYLIDVDTGRFMSYEVTGDGADMGDSGTYKAQTGIIKYFVANNFLVGESVEVEDDSTSPKINLKEDTPQKATYTTPAKREEIKKDLMSKEDAPSPENIAVLREHRQTLVEAGFEKEVAEIDSIMTNNPTQNDVMGLIISAEELLLNSGMI